jgi:hypothetical protein
VENSAGTAARRENIVEAALRYSMLVAICTMISAGRSSRLIFLERLLFEDRAVLLYCISRRSILLVHIRRPTGLIVLLSSLCTSMTTMSALRKCLKKYWTTTGQTKILGYWGTKWRCTQNFTRSIIEIANNECNIGRPLTKSKFPRVRSKQECSLS